MRILLFGGTTEGRLLTARLAALRPGLPPLPEHTTRKAEEALAGQALQMQRESPLMAGNFRQAQELTAHCPRNAFIITVCVASKQGAEALAGIEGIRILAGRKDLPEIEALCREHDLCVDATHPYAVLVSEHIQKACQNAGIPCLRLLRRETLTDNAMTGNTMMGSAAASSTLADSTTADNATADNTILVSSCQEAADFLEKQAGNILLAIGSKELACFSRIGKERLFVRVLPIHGSLTACEELGIPTRQILALQGPFSEAMNIAMLEQYQISWLVTKDGGKEGGMPEKLSAARIAGAKAVVVARPRQEYGEDLEAVFQKILGLLS